MLKVFIGCAKALFLKATRQEQPFHRDKTGGFLEETDDISFKPPFIASNSLTTIPYLKTLPFPNGTLTLVPIETALFNSSGT